MHASSESQRLNGTRAADLGVCLYSVGPHYITTIRDVEKVQRRTARFTHNCYTDTTPGCVANLINKLGLEPLEHRRMKQRLTMCYNIRRQYIEIDPGY